MGLYGIAILSKYLMTVGFVGTANSAIFGGIDQS